MNFSTRAPRAAAFVCLFTLLPALADAASQAAPERDHPEILAPPSETRGRRDSLVEALRARLHGGERGVFLVAGAKAKPLTEFRQNPDVLYLTGLAIPGAALVLTFSKKESGETLYLPARDKGAEAWTGPVLGPGAGNDLGVPDEERRTTRALTGMRDGNGGPGSGVQDVASLPGDLARLAGPGLVLFLPDDAQASEEGRAAAALAAGLQRTRPAPRVVSARPDLDRLRLVKSPWEVAAARRAAEITCDAQRRAMRDLSPGMKEYEVEAILEYVFTSSGSRFDAFPTIVASGPNSCTIHYTRNERTIRDGDLVVIDAGAKHLEYASDVTRTLPASGRFTADQERIYTAVLDAQKEGLDLVRPGARMEDIDQRVRHILKEKHLDRYILHSCCHWVGLEVHDVGDRGTPFEPGMILTVEPGVYMPEEGMGVRIEDTVLVTPEGHEVLSACVPKEVGEVQDEMALDAGPPLTRGVSGSPPPRTPTRDGTPRSP